MHTNHSLAPRRVVFKTHRKSSVFNRLMALNRLMYDPSKGFPEVKEAFRSWQAAAVAKIAADGETSLHMSSRSFSEQLPKGALVVGTTDASGIWNPIDPFFTELPASFLALGCACGLLDVARCDVPHEVELTEASIPPTFDLHIDLRGRGITIEQLKHAVWPLLDVIDELSAETDSGREYVKTRRSIPAN